jgi:hypothetical protein
VCTGCGRPFRRSECRHCNQNNSNSNSRSNNGNSTPATGTRSN